LHFKNDVARLNPANSGGASGIDQSDRHDRFSVFTARGYRVQAANRRARRLPREITLLRQRRRWPRRGRSALVILAPTLM
jgi:hypothetical protein